MINFSADFLENFLAVTRKYMQLRGGLTQKDLSEMTGVGISTMSRFLNLKTASVDEQLVANIIATLAIPLHEVIDGVAEDSTDTFKRLVQFYKDQKLNNENTNPGTQENNQGGGDDRPKQRTAATINIGGKKTTMPFGESGNNNQNTNQNNNTQATRTVEVSIREKLQTLSPRQKAYITDFLDLEVADRDLIVDLGDAVFRYVRQRNVEF